MLIFHSTELSPKPTKLVSNYPQAAKLYPPRSISIIRQEIMQPATWLRHQANSSNIC
jgi:hypothetical protein